MSLVWVTEIERLLQVGSLKTKKGEALRKPVDVPRFGETRKVPVTTVSPHIVLKVPVTTLCASQSTCQGLER